VNVLPEKFEVLVSHGPPLCGPGWLGELSGFLAPAGVVFTRVHTGADAVLRVEQGGLAGAMVIADPVQIDGLSLLRLIRSVDGTLPCWLVIEHTTRRTLQVALSLGVVSVIAQPVRVDELTFAMKRVLIHAGEQN